MSTQPFTTPAGDRIPKVDNKVAVGENLEFQRKWWRFEKVIWAFFLLILIADVLGLFGRGWLAKAVKSDESTVTLEYERFARASTPSIMTFHFGPNAIHDGRIQLYVSQSVIKKLGAQRVSPQPISSTLGNDGITYTFVASGLPATVEIELQPSFPGIQHFLVQVPGGQPLESKVLIFP